MSIIILIIHCVFECQNNYQMVGVLINVMRTESGSNKYRNAVTL